MVGQAAGGAIAIDTALVRRLLRSQFPRWADLPLEDIKSAGTDNALFRLGDTMSVRLPRHRRSAPQVAREYRWLPKLAPLPLAIPAPLAIGRPDAGYPWAWSVYCWLEGQAVTDAPVDPMDHAARDLAAFIHALQAIDATDGPPSGPRNEFRGAPLETRDKLMRSAVAQLADLYDPAALADIWTTALNAAVWTGTPVWVHGDLQPGNLLAKSGRLCAVIDFGLLGVGDPAVDLIIGWSLLPPGARAVFRSTLAVDDATWARGRGWAVSTAAIALAYYRQTNATLSSISRHTIDALLADRRLRS